MPKIIDYPRSSFSNALEMASAVASLGGSCTKASCADKMGLKMSGGFSARIGGAIKFELITSSSGKLEVTELYKSIRNAYNDKEVKKFEKISFLKPPLFGDLYEKFIGKELPVGILDKFLIREFEVPENKSSTVAKYFLDGLKYLDLIDSSNMVIGDKVADEVIEEIEGVEEQEDEQNGNYVDFYKPEKPSPQILNIQNNNDAKNIERADNEFIVHIIGPGMDSQIVIKEEEDLLIVDAMLKKVKKKLE